MFFVIYLFICPETFAQINSKHARNTEQDSMALKRSTNSCP